MKKRRGLPAACVDAARLHGEIKKGGACYCRARAVGRNQASGGAWPRCSRQRSGAAVGQAGGMAGRVERVSVVVPAMRTGGNAAAREACNGAAWRNLAGASCSTDSWAGISSPLGCVLAACIAAAAAAVPPCHCGTNSQNIASSASMDARRPARRRVATGRRWGRRWCTWVPGGVGRADQGGVGARLYLGFINLCK